MKSSLVLELQSLAEASSSELPELLRRAKVVATKLGLAEPLTWIGHELEGYPKDAAIPPYRKVPSELKVRNPFHGFVPVEFQKADWVWEHFSTTEMRQPIAEIVSLVAGEGSVLHGGLNPPEMDLLRRLGADVHLPMVRVMSKSAVERIIDGVRNQVLNWSLELEKQGILGENMTFSSEERERASSALTVNHVNYGTVVHGDNAQVAASQSGTATVATGSQVGAIASGVGASATGQVRQAQLNDLAEVRKLVDVLVTDLRNVPEDQRGDLLEHGSDLKEEVAKEAPKKSKLKATLAMLGTGIPAVITWAPKAVEAFEKIKHLLGR